MPMEFSAAPIELLVSSCMADREPPPVRRGASLTAVTLMVEVPASERELPSLACQEMVRFAEAVVGLSDVEL